MEQEEQLLEASESQPETPETQSIPDVPENEPTSEAIQTLLKQSMETHAELAQTRDLFEKFVEREQNATHRASEDEFIRNIRQNYESDPFQGAALLVGKAKDDLAQLMDRKIYEALGAREQFNRLLDDFLEEPPNATLKEFRSELEYLIRDRGVEPKQAADFLRTVDSKARNAATQKNEALREARTRATTESGGRSLETRDHDGDLARAFSQARNLEEMFAVLKRSRP
ncbi:MAG: hypothetical protein WC647_13140 [Desulfomonilaceae bacterium]|jgi:hypothetical protein